MISRVLVANRGEIAVRVIRACRTVGIEAVLAVSSADRDSAGARLADDTVHLGPAPAGESYLRPELVVAAALGKGCDAIHPGYGFLAESVELAALCEENGIVFVGPDVRALGQFGDKVTARNLAASSGVPVLPASEPITDPRSAPEIAAQIGYPLLVKAAAGGGGKGMRRVSAPDELVPALELAAAEAKAAFGSPVVYLERYVASSRHVEVQVVADTHGSVVHLGDRDCTVQRRHQKLIEEAPAPDLPPHVQEGLRESAVRLCRDAGYRSVGTVEFLVDAATKEYYFLEVNPRIQVEHGVTELVTGIDLVATQLKVAAGEPLPFTQDDVEITGHAVECRINAEDPALGFRPSPGRITTWRTPATGDHVRIDTHCFEGYLVPPYYDSLVAKVMTTGPTRDEAFDRMDDALGDLAIEGVTTTRDLQRRLIARPEVREMTVSTPWLDSLLAAAGPGAGAERPQPQTDPKEHVA